jgi:hypothetical protein
MASGARRIEVTAETLAEKEFLAELGQRVVDRRQIASGRGIARQAERVDELA